MAQTIKPILILGAGTEVVVQGIIPAARTILARRDDVWPQHVFVLAADADRRSLHRLDEANLPPEHARFVHLSATSVLEERERDPARFRDAWRDELLPALQAAPDNGACMLPPLGRLMTIAAAPGILKQLQRFQRACDAVPDVYLVLNPLSGTSRGSLHELPRLAAAVWPQAAVYVLLVYPVDLDRMDAAIARIYETNFVEALHILEQMATNTSFDVYRDAKQGWERQEGRLVRGVFTFDARYGNRRLGELEHHHHRLEGGLTELFEQLSRFLAQIATGDPVTDWVLGRLTDVTLHRARECVDGHPCLCHAVHETRLAFDAEVFRTVALERTLERLFSPENQGPTPAGTTELPPLREPDKAGAWLEERIAAFELAVREDASVQRLLGEDTRAIMTEVRSDPRSFARDASDRVRRYAAQTLAAAAAAATESGLRPQAMARLGAEILGRDPVRARQTFTALVDVLRAKSASLGVQGNRLFGGGQATVDRVAQRIQTVLDRATERAQRAGFVRRVVRSWQPIRTPMDDPSVRAEIEAIIRDSGSELDAGLEDAGRGAVMLALSRHYAVSCRLIVEWLEATENLEQRSRGLRQNARRRLARHRATATSGQGQHCADSSLIDDEVIDAFLDRAGISFAAWVMRGGISVTALASGSEDDLEKTARAWVDEQLGDLRDATIIDVLRASEDEDADAQRALLRFLGRGQPLMTLDDDLVLGLPEGRRGQYYVYAEVSDPALRELFAECCDQMGLPAPTLVPAERGGPTLRVMQLVTGVPFFAQAPRIRPMSRTHARVLGGGTRELEVSDPDLLRDWPGASRPLLPTTIEPGVSDVESRPLRPAVLREG